MVGCTFFVGFDEDLRVAICCERTKPMDIGHQHGAGPHAGCDCSIGGNLSFREFVWGETPDRQLRKAWGFKAASINAALNWSSGC
jgi:hypothetical protein